MAEPPVSSYDWGFFTFNPALTLAPTFPRAAGTIELERLDITAAHDGAIDQICRNAGMPMSHPDQASSSGSQGIHDAARDAVRSVPAGTVATHGDIAAIINTGPRQAGRVAGQVSDAGPWWRIVYVGGTSSTCHSGTAEELLRSEGIEFLGERVNMAAHRIASD